jgi:argininosuccinate lyase
MREELMRGYTQATDLAEYLVQTNGVDYRTAYVVVGETVRAASKAGVSGAGITGEMIDAAAFAHTGDDWGMAAVDLSPVLDPWQIVLSRGAEGGAAPDAVADMIRNLRTRLEALTERAEQRTDSFDRSEQNLIRTAREVVDATEVVATTQD